MKIASVRKTWGKMIKCQTFDLGNSNCFLLVCIQEEIWNTYTYRLVLKISAETGAKGRERKNQCKKKKTLNNKTIPNKEKNVNMYFY